MCFATASSCSSHEEKRVDCDCDCGGVVKNRYLYAYPLHYDFSFFILDAITDTSEIAIVCGRVDARTHTRAISVSIGDWSPRHIGQATYCTCPDSPLKVNDEQWVIGLRARAFLRSVRRFCRITWARARATCNPRHTCARVLFIDRSNTVVSQDESGNRGEKSENRRKSDASSFSSRVFLH